MKSRHHRSGAGFRALAVGCLVLGIATSAWAAKNLATVNGKAITEDDLKQFLSGFNEMQRSGIEKDPQARQQLLSNLIDQEVLTQTAIKEKLDQTADYRRALESFRRQYLANALINQRVLSRVTDTEAREYYQRNRPRFSTDQVHAFHILVETEAEAKSVLEEVKKSGTDFQAVAERRSKDPSAKNNRGDLGFFTRDRMVAEFADAAFAAKKGEIIGPVKTSYGFHIIKVEDKKAGKVPGFEEVELRVRNSLQQEMIQDYLGGLRRNTKISIPGASG